MLPDSIRRAVLACAKALPSNWDAHQRIRATTALVAWKRLDDCFDEQVQRRRDWGFPQPANIHWHIFYIPAHARFEVALDAHKAFGQLAAWNPSLREHVELLRPELRGAALHRARQHLLPLDFRESALESPDVVGLAYECVRYEYLRPTNDLGEFFTPSNLVEMMVQMNRLREGQKILDPSAGSGRMLQHAARFVRLERERHTPFLAEHNPFPPPLLLVAQDIQPFLVAMCQVSLLAMGYSNAICIARDSLREPILDGEIPHILRVRGVHRAVMRILAAKPEPDGTDLEVAPRTHFQVERSAPARDRPVPAAPVEPRPERPAVQTSLFPR